MGQPLREAVEEWNREISKVADELNAAWPHMNLEEKTEAQARFQEFWDRLPEALRERAVALLREEHAKRSAP